MDDVGRALSLAAGIVILDQAFIVVALVEGGFPECRMFEHRIMVTVNLF